MRTVKNHKVWLLNIYINKTGKKMKKLATILASVMLLVSATTSSYADLKYGFSGMVGGVFTDGTESEKTGAGDKEQHAESEGELFAGASIFVEKDFGNSWAFGIDWVPIDADLGSGSRIDTNSVGGSTSCDPAGVTCGTMTASAKLENLITYYITKTSDTGMYMLAGLHTAKLTTSETLPTSNYGDEDIFGGQIGFGIVRAAGNGEMRYQISYSDFESVTLNSTNDGTQRVEGEADAVLFKMSYAF